MSIQFVPERLTLELRNALFPEDFQNKPISRRKGLSLRGFNQPWHYVRTLIAFLPGVLLLEVLPQEQHY